MSAVGALTVECDILYRKVGLYLEASFDDRMIALLQTLDREFLADGKEIGRYVATSDSTNSKDGGGFTRTYDGTLAAIRGAALDIDAAAGSIAMTAQN